MKSIRFGSAIRGGFLGTLAMTALMYAAPLMGLPRMDLLLALGSVLPIGGLSPYVLGAAMHVAVGITLALLYAGAFEPILPGPEWVRGVTFSVAPWLFAVTLMGPAMAWLENVVHPAQADAVVNPCGAKSTPPAANPCGSQRTATSGAAASTRPTNPCASSGQDAAAAPSPWLLRVMSLMAHVVYGGVMATVYRRRA
jgi:hypothetical protein